MHTFYHGSPTAGLKTLRAGSFITPDLETARLMGMFYPDTGKTWTDEDLAEKHKFGQQPKWKEGREPTGKPHLYQLTVDALDNIDLLDNPYEHTIKQEMPVTPYNEQLRAAISQAVKQAAGLGGVFGNVGQNWKAPKPVQPPQPQPQPRAPATTPPPETLAPLLPVSKPFSLHQPSFVGRRMNYSPTTTLGAQVGRWYENAGGLNNAIEQAQQAQQNRNPAVLQKNVWPTWKPEDVTQREVPVLTSDKSTDISDSADGQWQPTGTGWFPSDSLGGNSFNSPRVVVRPNTSRAVLEHELTHNALLRDDKTIRTVLNAQQQSTTAPKPENTPASAVPKSMDTNEVAYITQPLEIDPRLAEIKRRYAHHTGNLVKTPQEAEQAWNWWRENNGRLRGVTAERLQDPSRSAMAAEYEQATGTPKEKQFYPAIYKWWNDKYNRTPPKNWQEESPTLRRDAFQLYDALPDEQKQQFFHRMPELVQQPNPAVQKFGASVKQAAGPSGALKAPPAIAVPHKSNLFTTTDTQETLGQNIGRWYQNAGGLNNAVGRAQQTQQQNTDTNAINRTKFPAWDINKVNTPVPIRTYGRANGSWYMGNADGQFTPDSNQVELRGSAPDIQAVKEHELTHAATIPGTDALRQSILAAATNNRIAYPDQPTEIDARLAEIKRRYAHHTGKLVDSPAEAQNAWEWWRQNQNKLRNSGQFERPEDKPTMEPHFFKRYDTYPDEKKQELFHRMPELVQQPNPAVQKFGASVKQADLKPEIILQPHQQRVADRVSGPNPRMLVYHGLGTGKSLAAIAAAEAAKKNSGGEYAIVAPASLRDNFRKEIDKFTTGSNPDILSYTGMGLGQQPKNNPETLIFDEAHRLRNPEGLAAQAATEAAQKVPRVVLLTGSPITNEPSDLANLMSILRNEKITPESFENKYVQYKKVKPGWGGWLRGVKPGEEADVKNPEELKSKLRGHVDFNPGKSPDGVNINQQIIDAPMTAEQERIQKAIRTKIPPRFLWKLDKEFPLSRDELSKLNSFLTGMRQISLSTQPFRADKDHFKAFEQSGKLQTALTKLRETLDSDPRKKALIYSNYIDAGLQPYAAALAKNKIPHAIFHGGIPLSERRKALDEYNAGKLKALLIGPAGAEGISTKGTSLIQLLDPHWNETRSQQAQGRGLRFDSHMDLPEELKNVAVQRFISRAKEPGWFKKHVLGAQKVRTGDEILDTLAKEKEKANEKFRAILKQVGSESQQEEVARRMYEENVPEEQQRKAASLAWHKMAASPFPTPGFSNQFNKPPAPVPMLQTLNANTPSRQNLLSGTYQHESLTPEPQVGKKNLFGWHDKPVTQQNTVTPAATNTTLVPYSNKYPWNWGATTENVTPPVGDQNRYRPLRDGATPSPTTARMINGVAYEPELVRAPEAYGGNLQPNEMVQNAPGNDYDNKHSLTMPAPPALLAQMNQDPAYEFDRSLGPAHMARLASGVISSRRDRAPQDLPFEVEQQIDRINRGADNWTARNYANQFAIGDPAGRNATHAALTDQIPFRAGTAYKRIMRQMFENKLKNTPNLSPFQVQRTNNLATTSHSISNPLADQIAADPRGPASHIRLGRVGTPGIFPLSIDNEGAVGLHELEHQRQAGNPFGSAQDGRNKAEHPAVLSEMVHAAEGVNWLNAGRPVKGRAPLTPNYQPGLEWMRRQARQHGHIGGDKSMTDLLNTPEGQAWLRMQYNELGQIPEIVARNRMMPEAGPIETEAPFTQPTSEADIRALARRFAVPQ